MKKEKRCWLRKRKRRVGWSWMIAMAFVIAHEVWRYRYLVGDWACWNRMKSQSYSRVIGSAENERNGRVS